MTFILNSIRIKKRRRRKKKAKIKNDAQKHFDIYILIKIVVNLPVAMLITDSY